MFQTLLSQQIVSGAAQSRNTQSAANYLFLQLLQCINNWAAANTGGGHIGRRAREKRAGKYIKVVTTKENEDGKNAMPPPHGK
jgi:hypothetical protein